MVSTNGILAMIFFVLSAYLMYGILSNPHPTFKQMNETGLLDMTPNWNRASIEKLHKVIGDDGLKYYAVGYKDLDGDCTFAICHALFFAFVLRALNPKDTFFWKFSLLMGVFDVTENACIHFALMNWPEHENMDLWISIGGKSTTLKFAVCAVTFLVFLKEIFGMLLGGGKSKEDWLCYI